MKALKTLFAAVAMLTGVLAIPAMAGKDDPLFVNLSSDNSHRAMMAVRFGKVMFEKGHPVTIFLNDNGVLVASTAKGKEFGNEQQDLTALMAKGVTVIVCQHCMMHHGVKEEDILKGVKLGTPDLIGDALFKDNTKTMTW